MSGPALSHLRFPESASRGRRYPEPVHPYRTDFQRDRDRLIHARAFRRLEDKTQVFTAGISDHFRNRLTHTIEVAQIARTAASALGLNEDLTETLALAHDVGHPPFAHAGEEELDRQMQRFGERFEHNLHALRIVEHFEQRYARFPGLNLTFEVREGIVKHSRDLPANADPSLQEYLPGLRPPLEAQLIDLADEIAYNAADLDDAYSAGFFTLEEIAESIPQYAELAEIVETQFAGAPQDIQFNECLRMLIDWLATGLIQGTLQRASAVASVEEVRDQPGRLAAFDEPSAATSKALKVFLRERVYYSDVLQRDRLESADQVARMFETFIHNPEKMPPNYASVSPVHRGVCDFIAGMTDGYFRRTYQSLFPSPSDC